MKTLTLILSSLLIGSFSWAQETVQESNTTETQSIKVVHKEDKSKDFQITPSILLLSVPHPMDGAIELVFSESFSVKLQKSFEPSITVDGDKAKFDNRSIGIRKYLGGPMFLGLAYGKHEVHATTTQEVNGFDAHIYANVESEYLTPTFGWKWVYDSGFTVGFELGWIFPFNAGSSVGSDQEANPLVAGSSEYQNAVQDAEDTAKKFASDGIPNICLLELGWTF